MAAKKTIAELDISIKQLMARKADLLKAQESVERKKAARQAIILGKWLIANDMTTVEKIKSSLVRDQDRIAFDLPILVKPEVAPGQLSIAPGKTDIQI